MIIDVIEILYFFGFKVVFIFLQIGNNDLDNRKLKINLLNYCKKILCSMVILL